MSFDKQSGSSHVIIVVGLVILLIAGLGYVFLQNHSKSNITKVSGNWTTFSSRYVPIVFDYPKEWEVHAVESDHTTSQSTIYAYINRGKPDEKIMLDISYMRLYTSTKQSSSAQQFEDAISDGVSIEPKCPADVRQSASSECAVVSNAVSSGYIYRGKGRDAKDVVRWHGQDSNDYLTVESYAADESTLENIIKSIRGSSSKSNRDMPILTNTISPTELAQNSENNQVHNDAVSSLDPKKCEAIQGITYKVSSSDPSKVTIFDEWQALIACRGEVNIAIKKDKAVSLQGDDCSISNKRYSHLRRIITNAEFIQRRAPLSVATSDGVKPIAFDTESVNDELPDNLNTTCEPISSNSLKEGDTVSIYVPIDNNDPEAYKYDTIVIQKVNSSLQ